MVTNIPSADEFYLAGEELLNFSWDAVARLIRNLDEAHYYGVDKDEVSEQYWEGANRILSTSLTVIQQGVEFFLKGRIASISPYLLITDSLSKLPNTSSTAAKVDFSKFPTLDSQDLIKVYNTFSDEPLEQGIEERFHTMRERRNSIMHSVADTTDLQVKEVIEYLLFMYKSFFPNKTWAERRVYFLRQSPDSELAAEDFAIVATCIEFSEVIKMLSQKEALNYLDIDRNQRAYFCPKCLDESHKDNKLSLKLARLRSKKPNETLLYCPICNLEHRVKREFCNIDNKTPTSDTCPGNVISVKYNNCLTCGY
ncbi:hypothetical protein I0G06_01920 [Klebsiella quasivariicola]|uniref:hypothetical protein n=1 Tax=Klebsiella quasivariicola TaxID=2026240 RepID=UPI0018A33356|nr:hypothetical protein [Klebsiella quasivariicola]MBF7818284.1 hypothetical protein [Klebsiella quasivariicola]